MMFFALCSVHALSNRASRSASEKPQAWKIMAFFAESVPAATFVPWLRADGPEPGFSKYSSISSCALRSTETSIPAFSNSVIRAPITYLSRYTSAHFSFGAIVDALSNFHCFSVSVVAYSLSIFWYFSASSVELMSLICELSAINILQAPVVLLLN